MEDKKLTDDEIVKAYELCTMDGGGMMSKAYNSICPCKACNERKVGCHSNCTSYKDWQKNGIEIKEPFIEIKRKRKRR